MNKLRVRFAPSPTGNVHIGNIRAAIFNWLLARNQKGKFLLRIEDTDRERSNDLAVQTLLDAMKWLGLDYDEEIFFQSKHLNDHKLAAENLIKAGQALKKSSQDPSKQAIIFLLPYECSNMPFVRVKGTVSSQLATNKDFIISRSGASYFTLENGKESERNCSLAGLYKLKIYDDNENLIFNLDEKISSISSEEEIKISKASKIEYVSREVFYLDHVKGELSKPLDSMKDFVIVRSDGSPVFHLANVCDDIAQNINFIIRGDDHVENTFRHLFLFHALGHQPPKYAHLPMIVNQYGKPYSKRDGDAYVGDFKSKGFLPQALFNYLALLGWSPGDDREKMALNEMIEAFSLDRVKSSPAKFDIQKLLNMNGLYIAEMPQKDFAKIAIQFTTSWPEGTPNTDDFAKIATIMQSRTKTLTQATEWKCFFYDNYEINQSDLEKAVSKIGNKNILLSFADSLAKIANPDKILIENMIRETEELNSISKGSLNLPIRLLLTGTKGGPSVEEIIQALGVQNASRRIVKKLS